MPWLGLKLFLLGVVFEIILLFVTFLVGATPYIPLLPDFQSAVLVIHSPLIWVLRALGDNNLILALVALPLVFAIMGLFWASVFYGILRLRHWLVSRVLVSAQQKAIAQRCLVWFVILYMAATFLYALPQAPRSFSGSPGTAAVIDANTDFAIDLYQRLRTQPGNLFFSPYSISSALAMTYAGARANTESEMAHVLHFDGQTNVHPGFRVLTDRINDLQRVNRIKLLTANSLWCQQDYSFNHAFMDIAKTDYHAEVQPVDFEKAPGAAANDINSWIDRKTEGKIQGMVEPDSFDPLTRLVLCNAIYFKGKWETQFSPGDTQPGTFYIGSNKTVTVPMMSLNENFKVARNEADRVDLLDMPYVGGELSMIIIMPGGPEWAEWVDPLQSFSKLEEKLTADNLRSWLKELDRAPGEKLEISIPRFTTTQSFNLSQQLKALGMPSAFNPGQADFSGMDGTTNLYVSDVLHKAYVAVDESGTEAAAATVVSMVAAAEPEAFVANRPFIFLIRDNGSGAILFLGRMVDPTK
jgi:serpin B